jgi:arylsulfatase A-like enzyme
MSLSRRAFLGSLATSAFAAPAKPNVLLILSDDHGYGDVSCYEHPNEVSTPNIDRIAQRGIRFTQGYASCYVCAPTRASILTGRYSQRYGFYTASDSRAGLPLTEITLAELLRKEGYRTAALGKWHLGLEMPYHPINRGFDEFYGFVGHGGHDYFDLKPAAEPATSIWRNDKVISDTGYLTDNLGREAVQFIQRNEKRNWFLYLAFNAVHFPMQAPAETIAKYNTGKPNRNILLAMLEHEDRAIGHVLDELKTRGLDKNTLVFFLSDNGGARANSSNNGPLRDFKASVYEGGIRVPFLLSWPAKLPQGKTVNEPVICMDMLPTAVAAAGAALPANREYHGRNLLPLAAGKHKGPLHESLYWDANEDRSAIRNGRWKLVINRSKIELFDLESDPGEKRDLAAAHPDELERLQSLLSAWKKLNPPGIRGAAAGDDDEDQPNRKKKERKKKKG